MMRLIAFCSALLLLACNPSMESEASTDPLRLRVDPETAAPGDSVTLVLQNDTSDDVGYNLCNSALQVRSGDAWEPVPSDRVCTMELRMLTPGNEDSFTLQLPTDLAPGEYRFTTSIEVLPSGTTEALESSVLRVE